ncbi:IS66 family transposase [Variovorax ureilyticus]|uniref:IS66 family transposase n=1 Tax=Variovorax ureilyticus TaxID=1836198 RepID=A0ABU8VRZ9_9BURK
MSQLLELTDDDLKGLGPEAVTALAQQMLQRLREQELHIAQRDQALKLKDAKIEKITFELARLKRWKFGASAEAMSAEQRRLFEETCAEDEADLQEQLRQLQGEGKADTDTQNKSKRKPRREKLPDHLRRVEHRHEPAQTTCPTPGCGSAMQRVGEDVSERLDVVPAEFFVHRHIYGKWACRCCQRKGVDRLVQEPVEPSIIDGGIPASGLVAHTLISRFVDHLPYYRQEAINARSGVHTPRSTLAQWSGQAGAALHPLFEAHRRFVLECAHLHVDETPVSMLDPGAGKTRRAYVWGYARGAFDPTPGVVYDFCLGRGAQYPLAFLGGCDERPPWTGTLTRDEYAVYDSVVRAVPGRIAAGCLAHARRKYDQLLRDGGKSAVAAEAIARIAAIYRLERELATLGAQERHAERQSRARRLWDQLHEWLILERRRVPDGSATARALDYSLNSWSALVRNLEDGNVNVDNNSLENLMRPWAMGRRAWLFAGSELAGKRAAVVMSLVHSARLNGHDPYAYLRDVLERLPTHLNSRIDELLPHRWQPAA